MDNDKNEVGDDNDEVTVANQVASDSPNRSSSFLFDSLHDSSLLAALSPHHINQSEKEECGQEVRIERPHLSTQEQWHSELANEEAEKQEAIQWGESFFNLSEWGDSLLVGEHFLEKQSVLRHTERTPKEQVSHLEAQQPNAGQLAISQSGIGQIQLQPTTTTPKTTTTIQNEYNKGKSSNSPTPPYRIEESRKNGKKEKEDSVVLKLPSVQNAPESILYCSPGLQEIFDLWPSMSDQPWQNITADLTGKRTQTAAATEVPKIPQSSIQVSRKRGNLNVQVVAAESDDQKPSRHDSENVTERPGFAGDLIPPTQETPPITPRIQLTTSSVQSPLNHSTPSTLLLGKLAAPKIHQTLLESEQYTKVNPTTLSHSTLKPKPLPHSGQNLSPPQDCSSPSPSQPKPLSDTKSPVNDDGFTLKLSQDASLCSSNSGNFSIIDVASDRRLFHTFINEWKTKDRYSLALACEKKEHRQQPEEEIGGKHNRGN